MYVPATVAQTTLATNRTERRLADIGVNWGRLSEWRSGVRVQERNDRSRCTTRAATTTHFTITKVQSSVLHVERAGYTLTVRRLSAEHHHDC